MEKISHTDDQGGIWIREDHLERFIAESFMKGIQEGFSELMEDENNDPEELEFIFGMMQEPKEYDAKETKKLESIIKLTEFDKNLKDDIVNKIKNNKRFKKVYRHFYPTLSYKKMLIKLINFLKIKNEPLEN